MKLLRVLQEREFERVGDTTTNRVDVRVIAASNRDLYAEVDAERFREDLYWRLNVVPIVIPPLRMRREDIPALVAHFLNYYSEKNDKNVVHIQAEAIEALQDYHWPGNVRELQNYVERAVAMADGDELTVELLPDAVLGRAERRAGRIRGVDLETLVFEVVQQGVSTAASGGDRPAREDRQPRRARADRPGDAVLQQRANQGRHPPGHQPQHACAASCSNTIWKKPTGTNRNKFRMQNAEFRKGHIMSNNDLRDAYEGICVANHQVGEFTAARPCQRCDWPADTQVRHFHWIQLARGLPCVFETAFHYDYGDLPSRGR